MPDPRNLDAALGNVTALLGLANALMANGLHRIDREDGGRGWAVHSEEAEQLSALLYVTSDYASRAMEACGDARDGASEK